MMADVPRILRSRRVRWVFIAASVLGLIIGLDTLVLHLRLDPLADVRAYYDAGARLNAGLPLYVQTATTDDPGLLPLSAAPRHRLPAARPPPVRDRGAHLGGVPHRPVRRDPGPPRAAQRVDLDRQRLAGRADRLEPGRRPGAGRGHLPRRARGAVGRRAGGPPQDPAGHRRDLLARPARLARRRAVRRRGWSGCRSSRSSSSRPGRSRSSGSPTWRRSATSRTARCTRSRRVLWARLRRRAARPGAALRADVGGLGAGGRRRPCWSARGSCCTSCRRCRPRSGHPTTPPMSPSHLSPTASVANLDPNR